MLSLEIQHRALSAARSNGATAYHLSPCLINVDDDVDAVASLDDIRVTEKLRPGTAPTQPLPHTLAYTDTVGIAD